MASGQLDSRPVPRADRMVECADGVHRRDAHMGYSDGRAPATIWKGVYNIHGGKRRRISEKTVPPHAYRNPTSVCEDSDSTSTDSEDSRAPTVVSVVESTDVAESGVVRAGDPQSYIDSIDRSLRAFNQAEIDDGDVDIEEIESPESPIFPRSPLGMGPIWSDESEASGSPVDQVQQGMITIQRARELAEKYHQLCGYLIVEWGDLPDYMRDDLLEIDPDLFD